MDNALRRQAYALAEAEIDARHMNSADMTQIADDLRFTYCLDLFGQGHAWLVQTALMPQDVVCWHVCFFDFSRKRNDDQGRCKSVAVVVLNDNNRAGASLNVTMMLAEVSKVNVAAMIVPTGVKHNNHLDYVTWAERLPPTVNTLKLLKIMFPEN